ncbi:MAG: T9SS type A sorting domain-containing protein [Candidatus Cloacimonetes bacterium]|nr:T9SS type A sorting domain-containing protein [Candidatus Cloacimonadota bacterium]MCK9243462.1 T9SS type A sorting domain-containing protein [Candidatus Cloacimonadota bacterium]
MKARTLYFTRAILVIALFSIVGVAVAQTNVTTVLDLWNVRTNLSGNYKQTADIDLSVTNPANLIAWSADSTYVVGDIRKNTTDGYAYFCAVAQTQAGIFAGTNWTKMWEASKGWKPIGDQTDGYNNAFKGVYDGDGKTVLNLYIDRGADAQTNNSVFPANGENNVGLFGFVSSSTTSDTVIKNLGIINPNITGKRGTGALVGKVMIPAINKIKKVYVINCYAQPDGGTGTATVAGFGATGGLVGANNSDRKQQVPVIRYSHANVTVSSTHPQNQALNSGDNNNPYNIKYGGLVGCNETGVTEDSYARGNVSGGDRVGGLAGCTIGGAIFRSYSTGSVTQGISSTGWQGGFGRLVGLIEGRLPPGLGGTNATGSCEDCYYLSSSILDPTTGSNTVGTGLTDAQMKVSSNFTNWDFTNVWKIDSSNNDNYPYHMASSSATYHYRSVYRETGSTWSIANDWETSTDGTSGWAAASNSPTAYNSLSITVRNGHTMTVNADVIIDQTTVENGGKIVVSSGKTLTVRDGDSTDLKVEGELEHSGTLTLNSSSYSLVSGTLTSKANSTLNLSGELDITGTHTIETNANLNYSDNSKKIYAGSSAQAAGANFPGTVYDLIINNSAGVTFSKGFSVRGTLSLLQGSYTLSSGSASVNGYHSPEVSYFYMSKNDFYLTAGFAISTDTNQTDSRYIKRQWTLSGNVDDGAATSRTKTLTFFWTPDDDYDFSWGSTVPKVYLGANTTGFPVSASSLTTNPRWVKIDYAFPQNASKASMSFKIGLESGQTLPVELSSFTALPYQGSSAMLQWRTQTETNVLGFSIYRGLEDDLTTALHLDILIPATNTSQPKTYVYYDRDVEIPNQYYYWLESNDFDGNSQIYGPVNVHLLSDDSGTSPQVPVPGLRDVYPNPFNPQATIRYGVNKASSVEIKIYNYRGQLVRNLMNSEKPKGWHQVIWDGKNDNGNKVTSGIYFSRMTMNGKNYLRKMVMMK